MGYSGIITTCQMLKEGKSIHLEEELNNQKWTRPGLAQHPSSGCCPSQPRSHGSWATAICVMLQAPTLPAKDKHTVQTKPMSPFSETPGNGAKKFHLAAFLKSRTTFHHIRAGEGEGEGSLQSENKANTQGKQRKKSGDFLGSPQHSCPWCQPFLGSQQHPCPWVL